MLVEDIWEIKFSYKPTKHENFKAIFNRASYNVTQIN